MTNLQKDVALHIQEVNQTPNSIVLKKYVTKIHQNKTPEN